MFRLFRKTKISTKSSRMDSKIVQFREWLSNYASSEYDLDHQVRYIETYSRLAPFLQPGKRWLELGGESRLSSYLRSMHRFDVQLYEEDLRYDLSIEDDAFDVILSLEVIEHIKDQTETAGIGEIATFTYSGVKSLFRECYRVLRPGGILFMSTPNACSVDAIGRLFAYKPAQGYAPHVKEYAGEELVQFAQESGFAPVSFSIAFVWNPIPEVDRTAVFDALRRSGVPTHDRGDDMFLVFRK